MTDKPDHIARHPPPVGSRVKVWYDGKAGDLLVQDATGRVTWDIYALPLSDGAFETETSPRGVPFGASLGAPSWLS